MFRLAHLSDPHLAPLPRPSFSDFNLKRLFGFINWHRNRRQLHLSAVLEKIVADLKAHTPDHIAVTGDLVNISLAAEFGPARTWLEQLGTARDVTLVPGNHDIYLRSTAGHADRHWGEYMRGVEQGAVLNEAAFPFVRRREGVALVGISTAVPVRIGRATGFIGGEQLERLAKVLAELKQEGLFRTILMHHPPASPPERRHERLKDGAAFQRVLQQHGAELVLHGHEHVVSVQWFDAPEQPVPAIGVPSASATPAGKKHPAAWNLYEIDATPGRFRCAMISRGLTQAGGEVVELARRNLLD
jgi:3',5'-cyclic AMP phosphodiesterase CpdA